MALPLPPNSHLQAVLLVTKSRSLGPRLVFHYPPISPSAAALLATKAPAWFGNDTTTGSIDESNASSSDWDSSTEPDGADDDNEAGSRTSAGRGSGRTAASHRDREKLRPAAGAWGRQESFDEDDVDGHAEGDGVDTDKDGKHKGGDRDWDTVLGFKVDALEKMLCPTKAFNKRRFELGVESVVFVGAPMFVRDDGLWKKRKKRRNRSQEDRLHEGDMLANLTGNASDQQESSRDDKRLEKKDVFVLPPGFEAGYGHDMDSAVPSAAASDVGSDVKSDSTTNNTPDMSMFNVVFVLNPPALEHQMRVKDMYDNVTKKYAKALKYEEARFQYVWKESKRIIDIKQRAKENGESLTATWRKIVSTSPLAKSLATMFDAISTDKIAHIHFDASFNTSFQIPQADSTPYLPNAMEPQMPGLWLTTSNVVIDDDHDAPMTQHASLLLLQDPEVILKDLQAEKANAAALSFYIRTIVPTKSLLKISMKHNIDAKDMEYIASHLVYWRRARLITPLHPRDTYIVSPNADLSNLQAAMGSYAQRFPTLPSLPKMLSLLSQKPKEYRYLIPTAEHRDAYMDILAWLMRGGWVTQLRTFAWVRVSPEIKAEVAADMEREERMKKEQQDNESLAGSLRSDKRSSFLSAGTVVGGPRPGTPLRKSRRDIEGDEEMDASTILSPRIATTSSGPGWRGSPVRASSDAGSTSSARTTIPYNAAGRPTSPSPLQLPSPLPPSANNLPHRPSPLHLKSPSPSRALPFSPTSPTQTTNQPPPSPPPSPEHFTASLVLSPQRANAVEARWLEAIGKRFTDADLRAHWSTLLKYFDGKHAVEDICPREGLKRKRVAAMMQGIREGGWLVVVRHW
ncbi:Nitrogen permease regulator 3 [Paraconiothyrium brasiliense]|uniref:Nitrogen permease regulator 3 n=1 Tax=Paraconiothyrium brasiliense TaxID=300254 RepID=A0ABR3RTX5_9PLEO